MLHLAIIQRMKIYIIIIEILKIHLILITLIELKILKASREPKFLSENVL